MGRARVSSRLRGAASCLDGLHQAGALKLLFPRGRPGVEAVMVNTAGGITGGDSFSLDAEAGAGSHLTLTTQAAERAYKAQAGQTGRMETQLAAAPGARLDWLPQETILFNGSDFSRSLTVELAQDARFLMVEPVIFGRAAMGEVLSQARFCDRVRILRAGRCIYADGVRLEGDIHAALAGPAVASGAGAMAALVLAAPEAEAQLAPLRALMPATGGVSLLADDLLAMRLLAGDGYALRRTLLPVLDRLLPGGLPRSWSL